MTTPTGGVHSLESEIRQYWRLRLKHRATTEEAQSYRTAIRDHIQKLRAIRLAQLANTDLLLPRKKRLKRPPTHSPLKSGPPA